MGFEVSWTEARVRDAKVLTPTVRAIDLEPVDGARRFEPGAHINVEVSIDGRSDTRHYSAVGEGPRDGAYRVAVRRVRDSRGGSAFMWTLEPGARVRISHPHSLFELSFGAPEYLLIAGGIGITPIIGMAYHLERAKESFRLLYGGRERADMPFLDEMAERLGDRLVLYPDDEHRHINLEAEFARLHPEAEAYVCGPMGMLDAARRTWVANDRPEAHLRFETFASSGAYPAEPFVVNVADHGISLTVAENETILDALDKAGVPVMYDCRRGECGLCAVRILAADSRIDHRDVFLSEEQRLHMEKLCTCVSRVVGGSITIDTGFRPGAAAGAQHANVPSVT